MHLLSNALVVVVVLDLAGVGAGTDGRAGPVDTTALVVLVHLTSRVGSRGTLGVADTDDTAAASSSAGANLAGGNGSSGGGNVNGSGDESDAGRSRGDGRGGGNNNRGGGSDSAGDGAGGGAGKLARGLGLGLDLAESSLAGGAGRRGRRGRGNLNLGGGGGGLLKSGSGGGSSGGSSSNGDRGRAGGGSITAREVLLEDGQVGGVGGAIGGLQRVHVGSPPGTGRPPGSTNPDVGVLGHVREHTLNSLLTHGVDATGEFTDDTLLVVGLQPLGGLLEALLADRGADTGLGSTGAVGVKVLVHLIDDLVLAVGQARQVVVVGSPVPGTGVGVTLDEDVLCGGTSGTDTVDSSLVEVQNQGLLHVMVLVVYFH